MCGKHLGSDAGSELQFLTIAFEVIDSLIGYYKGINMFLVINLSGTILAEFSNEDLAHNFADNYGIDSGRFAYVEYVFVS